MDLEIKCIAPNYGIITAWNHDIISHKMMKNFWMKVVLKYQSSTILQRKDIVSLIPEVAKQWKLRSNGHLTYPFGDKHQISQDLGALSNKASSYRYAANKSI